MLYHLYEAQRALLAPFAEFASASTKLYTHPLSPLSHMPAAQRVSAGMDLLHRLGKDYEKPEFNLKSVNVAGVDVAVQELEPISKPFCRLLRFKRFTDDAHVLQIMKDQPKVLVVAPLSGHHSTLLRDTVRSLLKDHKVYITDWRDARTVPAEAGPFHLDDYVEYVQEFIRHIGPDVTVISVCQPTVPVLGAISLMASRGEPTPRCMVMMGGPIDARRSPTAVNNLAMNKSLSWFENNVLYRVPAHYPGASRLVYPGFLQHTGFVAMNPDRHMSSHYDYFLDLIRGDDDSAEAHRTFYDEYNAVLDMPAEYYMDTIQVVFQDFALCNGTWKVRGELVRPQDITKTALLTVEGELDDISGAGQTHAAHELCTGIPRNAQFKYDAKGAGHYGIFSGRRWREMIYPAIRDFIAQHQEVKSAPAHAPIVALTDEAAPVAAPPSATAAPARKTPKPAEPSQAAAPLKRAAAAKSVSATASTKAAAPNTATKASAAALTPAKATRKPASKTVKR